MSYHIKPKAEPKTFTATWTYQEKFYLTFGQDSPLKGGWVEIMARDMKEAHNKAKSWFGTKWDSIYTDESFDKKMFPKGKIGDDLLYFGIDLGELYQPKHHCFRWVAFLLGLLIGAGGMIIWFLYLSTK